MYPQLALYIDGAGAAHRRSARGTGCGHYSDRGAAQRASDL